MRSTESLRMHLQKKKHVFPIDFKITKEDGKLEW